ncbi:MAG: gamma-glutamylcyclotransferase [Bauldia sp.]|jgi:gamma-glutamylcyclotransferase (GGCT)/AIG2-like uncharacterized protein YtfP|nr:gamma-glutamylcyclotransferase [Bauldia sp.]
MPPPRLVLYGSLRRGEPAYGSHGLDRRLRFVMPCTIRGRLFDCGPYPAFVPGDGIVHGELFEAMDTSIVSDLDAFEEVDPANPAGGLYARELIAIEEGGYAFVYRYNPPIEGLPEIVSGDWVAHRRERTGAALDPLSLEQAALAAHRDGRFADAIPLWEALIELNPIWEFGAPHYDLACCLEVVGRRAEAETAFRKAIEIDPSNRMFLDGLAGHLEARRKGYL